MVFSPKEIELLLVSIKRRPVHAWGQNFLLDEEVVKKMAEAAVVEGEDEPVLEIGPGLGILTQALLDRLHKQSNRKLIAVEKDYDLGERLPKLLRSPSQLKVVTTDALDFDRSAWFEDGHFILASNLPFGITNQIFHRFLTTTPRPRRLVLMVQKEVADRVLARPSDSARGLLSIMAEYYSARRLICVVPKTSFWPVPKVNAAVVCLEINRVSNPSDRAFFKLVKNVFAGRRKTLLNALPSASNFSKDRWREELERLGIESTLRPQDLSLMQWQKIFAVVKIS